MSGKPSLPPFQSIGQPTLIELTPDMRTLTDENDYQQQSLAKRPLTADPDGSF